MLCCAGVEKYYQIARCFRDEDLRSDRRAPALNLEASRNLAALANRMNAFWFGYSRAGVRFSQTCVCLCRQPEFTQLDMEMAFMDRDSIMSLVEDLVVAVFQRVTACDAALISEKYPPHHSREPPHPDL